MAAASFHGLGAAFGRLAILAGAGLASSPARAVDLMAPGGIPWGARPEEAYAVLASQYKFVGPQPAEANPDEFLHEQRYAGAYFGIESDHIAPLFYLGRFFALAVSWSPKPDLPATQIWYAAVDRLIAQYGQPRSRTKPERLVSHQAVLKLHPEEANNGPMLAMYNAADHPRERGEYLLLDLTVRARGWVPEAVWEFRNGATIKAVMRARGPDANGILFGLKPALIYSKYDTFK